LKIKNEVRRKLEKNLESIKRVLRELGKFDQKKRSFRALAIFENERGCSKDLKKNTVGLYRIKKNNP
jgi:hypothetical protein